MTMMRFGSGTYNVRDSESFNPHSLQRLPSDRYITCTVFFLDMSQRQFQLDRHADGQDLLNKVFAHLELVERDFFGLQFLCVLNTNSCGVKRWLEPTKSIKKQMTCPPYNLFFRVKFYVSDPSKLAEEYTRYHFYLQVRSDLLEGRLNCSEKTAAVLGSYAAQSEFGDYTEYVNDDHYLDHMDLLPGQSHSLMRAVRELHKLRIGETPAASEFNFLNVAKTLDTYGMHWHEAKDGDDESIRIGVNSYGMSIFQNKEKKHSFPWSWIMKLSFKRKQFYVQIRSFEHNANAVDTILIFNALCQQSCKMLWKSCIEHHTFFRLIAPPAAPPKKLFNLMGSRFRYSGRTEYQTIEEMRQKPRVERVFERSRGRSARSTFNGLPPNGRHHSSSRTSTPTNTSTTNSPNLSARLFSSTASSCSRSPRSGAPTTIVPVSPILSRSSVDSQRGGSVPRETQLESGHSTLRRNGSVTVLAGPHQNASFPSNGHAPQHQRIHSAGVARFQSPPSPQHGYDNMIAATHQASTSSPHHLNNRPSSSADYQQKRQSLTQPLPNGSSVVVGIGSAAVANAQMPVAFPLNASTIVANTSSSSSSSSSRTNQPVWNRQRFGSNNNIITPHNGTIPNGSEIRMAPAGSRASLQAIGNYQALGFVPTPARLSPKLLTNGSNGSPRNSVASHSSTSGYGSNGCSNGYHSSNGSSNGYSARQSNGSPYEDGLVVVKVRPDSQGRYGFNVKGGIDHDHPVIVSRVASGSPADRSSPRLNEGDQVVMINGRDCTAMCHDVVVKVIRAAREHAGGELRLTIKPNVYRSGDVDESENSTNREAPESRHVSETVPRSDLLSQSLLLLKSLSESELKAEFAALYRKRPGLTMDISRLPNNLHKNRYRDVCPYDSTRVKLQTSTTGDYINGSYINMEIPSSGIVNRYIACQGPLPHTSGDFWLMVWEQLCQTIVMLTTLVENGRTKCHEYWPKPGESIPFGKLIVTNLSERESGYCNYREFSIRHQQSKEERRVTQMQYTAWPDHGVPEKPSDFIDFVDEVRSARAGSVDPIVVHCSAGIGRTGVLILMETAACLVEANQPVYPLDVMKTMRDQRATLVQTESQYVFVCHAIIKAYEDGLIKPLAEYQSSR